MTTRTASIGWWWYAGVDNVNGAAKLPVGCDDNDLIVGFDMFGAAGLVTCKCNNVIAMVLQAAVRSVLL